MAKIKTTEFKKNCAVCGCAFIGKGPAAKLCPVHVEESKLYQRVRNRERIAESRAASGAIKRPGVGKGGNPLRGSNHPSYIHGWYMADRLRVTVKKERRYCERCKCDLLDANRWLWVVHHKDHNHYNNVISNLELLCKRCHQIEHECHKAFDKGATTIPKGSRVR